MPIPNTSLSVQLRTHHIECNARVALTNRNPVSVDNSNDVVGVVAFPVTSETTCDTLTGSEISLLPSIDWRLWFARDPFDDEPPLSCDDERAQFLHDLYRDEEAGP